MTRCWVKTRFLFLSLSGNERVRPIDERQERGQLNEGPGEGFSVASVCRTNTSLGDLGPFLLSYQSLLHIEEFNSVGIVIGPRSRKSKRILNYVCEVRNNVYI